MGRYIPPRFGEVELTPEEQEALRKREERKDRLHQNYLRRKANGKQKEYEERTKTAKKADTSCEISVLRLFNGSRGLFIKP